MADVRARKQRETLTEAKIRLTVRAILASREMTGADFAALMGMTKVQAYDRLKGAKPFTTDEVGRMAEIFHMPIGAFFEGPDRLFSRSIATRVDANNLHYSTPFGRFSSTRSLSAVNPVVTVTALAA